MIFLKAFKLSERKIGNPNIYPYNVLRGKSPDVFVFDKVTVLYGSNGCGKSTMLNIIANKLNLEGKERDNPPVLGHRQYFKEFVDECGFTLGENENGRPLYAVPQASRYFKSEEILYEVRKIQQDAVLSESIEVDIKRRVLPSYEDPQKRFDIIQFGQDKFSNGETTMRFLENNLHANALYLLDEPEVSLSPQNQVKLAEMINQSARLLGNQFIISTHSPFMLGTLNAKIYDLDTMHFEIKQWTQLGNVRYFYNFFNDRREEFFPTKKALTK